MPDRDYYEVLGVARDATADAIKKAYRTQARKYHPDVNPGDKKAESRFKEVQQAYDILSDPEKRALYNNYGNAAFEGATAGPRAGAHEWTARQAGPGSGYDQSFDFNDFFGPGGAAGAAEADPSGGGIFEELLGRMRGGKGRQQRPTGPRPGRNVEAHLTIPFITAIRGGETKFDIEREDGKHETLAVKVPPGVETGAKLRLRGQGEPGEQGGARGDLTIHVTVEPHPYFTRDGRNLSVEVPITVPEAALGAKIVVPTLDGTKSLPIPPGTSSGQKLRLRGQGVPESGGKPAGDLFLIPKIVVPKKVDETSQRLIQEFAERNPLNPREGIW
ncbi:molecular chaperone DnaJ/curved DNA-binding protein [Singulisphaera sp. GP187]|uniref:DnaJ C-terminal domain-containing protein n=1 Tax=Singulisphaera sp. GP187 TaxID=1882752 RepID=UPI00092BD53C|nr:DnaJ C-terminal domain-containing protein [Singulisphaera sp. GP187]SIO57834.1 molecular chaperone DnaJ/curved DNA-binding protein [Singulisphaera sp. GP187]